MDSIVLLSGGMDSTLTAAIAVEESDKVSALHLNYRNRTEGRELRAFHEVADALGIEQRLVVDIEFLRTIGGSSLTDQSMQLRKAEASIEVNELVPNSYVPFRNGNFLSIAASWAEVIKAERIYIGAVEEDSSGYPDCTEEFFFAFEKAIQTGTRPETKLEIATPVIHMRKTDIVWGLVNRGAPIEKTWSCYASEDIACGECDSCALRLRGFRQAGIEDPIPYRKRPTYY